MPSCTLSPVTGEIVWKEEGERRSPPLILSSNGSHTPLQHYLRWLISKPSSPLPLPRSMAARRSSPIRSSHSAASCSLFLRRSSLSSSLCSSCRWRSRRRSSAEAVVGARCWSAGGRCCCRGVVWLVRDRIAMR